MALTFTNHTLEKLETLLADFGYRVRYEEGNFKTGSCLIAYTKIIVVNKFSNLESKIIALVELVKAIDSEASHLTEKQKAFYYALKQTKIEF
jgi:hypothetical protein